jgi:hypothetical protein
LLSRVIPAALITILLAGCSSSGQQVVFRQGSGFSAGAPFQTQEVENVGLSWSWLDNISSSTVRITSVRFADPPASLHLLNVNAYSYKNPLLTGEIIQAGVLPDICPREFIPRPVTEVIVPAHRNADWLIILTFTISRPGVYRLNRVRINYEADGHAGWQYQNIFMTLKVSNPPLPGPRPLPPSAVCYNPKTDP